MQTLVFKESVYNGKKIIDDQLCSLFSSENMSKRRTGYLEHNQQIKNTIFFKRKKYTWAQKINIGICWFVFMYSFFSFSKQPSGARLLLRIFRTLIGTYVNKDFVHISIIVFTYCFVVYISCYFVVFFSIRFCILHRKSYSHFQFSVYEATTQRNLFHRNYRK